jgi:cobalt-zinc-cadmium efflux system membrane fusion protein
MMAHDRITLGRPALAAGAIALLAIGAGATYLAVQRPVRVDGSGRDGSRAVTAQPPAASEAPPPSRNTVVKLSQDAVKRAGIELVPVTGETAASAVRIPGTVEPNAYKQVVVTPLVAGRVTRVLVELGAHVRRGQTLAEIFSPELADAETRFLAAKAELEAHERELDRTTKLAAIGAASQQELERLHAEHAAKAAGVQSLRSRLVLLGMPAPAIDALAPGKDIDATTRVPAPMAGVVTERGANVGSNVETSTRLFTVVDLSSVWIEGALYERDFSRVRVGSPASVTTSAYSGVVVRGRVSYIDPQVNASTRTARVRVEVANPRQELRLGMYADIEVAAATGAQAMTVPRSAVQTVDDRQVVYVVQGTEPGTFVERTVRLGDAAGDRVEVLSGLHPGDQVVSKGSFFLRAERERVGGIPAR